LLASAISRRPTTDLAVAAARYDGATLRTSEEARDRAQQGSRRRVASTLRGWARADDACRGQRWGRLTATAGGVLRAADGSTVSAPVTGPLEGTTLQGDGWSATLNSGWVVRPAAPSGSFNIVRGN
jgi:hypothetical protein